MLFLLSLGFVLSLPVTTSFSSFYVIFLNDNTQALFLLEPVPEWIMATHLNISTMTVFSDRPLTPIIDILLTFTPYLSRQVGKLTSGFRKIHAGLSRKEIIT